MVALIRFRSMAQFLVFVPTPGFFKFLAQKGLTSVEDVLADRLWVSDK